MVHDRKAQTSDSPPGSHDTASQLAAIATQLHAAPDQQHTVSAVVAQAVGLMPEATDASITVRTRRQHLTLASSSERARQVDALQYELEEGPCIRVADGAEWVRSGGVRSDERWPVWGPKAAGLGVGSLLSIPLTSVDKTLGALNIYSDREGSFPTREEAGLALVFAVHAAHAMAAAAQLENLGIALVSRHDIGVAQGIIMERFGLDQQQSFDLLRRLSSHQNVKLAEVAREVVRSGRVPTDEDA